MPDLPRNDQAYEAWRTSLIGRRQLSAQRQSLSSDGRGSCDTPLTLASRE